MLPLGLAAERQRQCGFTLIEVLVSLAVLSIVVVPLMGLFTVSLRTVDGGRAQVTAAFHAQAQIDAFISARARGGALPPETGTLDGGRYSFTRTTAPHSSGLMKVEIIITWLDRGINRSLRVVSLIAP